LPWGAWAPCRSTGSRLRRSSLRNSIRTQAPGPSAIQLRRSLAPSASNVWPSASRDVRSWISCTNAVVSLRWGRYLDRRGRHPS
jgi:hypothetical protein